MRPGCLHFCIPQFVNEKTFRSCGCDYSLTCVLTLTKKLETIAASNISCLGLLRPQICLDISNGRLWEELFWKFKLFKIVVACTQSHGVEAWYALIQVHQRNHKGNLQQKSTLDKKLTSKGGRTDYIDCYHQPLSPIKPGWPHYQGQYHDNHLTATAPALELILQAGAAWWKGWTATFQLPI